VAAHDLSARGRLRLALALAAAAGGSTGASVIFSARAGAFAAFATLAGSLSALADVFLAGMTPPERKGGDCCQMRRRMAPAAQEIMAPT
jgi:hypothetical protein